MKFVGYKYNNVHNLKLINNLILKNMKNKIVSITEKVPQVTTLPDGLYNGIWGGYEIDITYKAKQYILTTEEGVRGINIKVVVEIKDSIATFDTLN